MISISDILDKAYPVQCVKCKGSGIVGLHDLRMGRDRCDCFNGVDLDKRDLNREVASNILSSLLSEGRDSLTRRTKGDLVGLVQHHQALQADLEGRIEELEQRIKTINALMGEEVPPSGITTA